ncbi:MAG: zinc ribbon domain-containing protein [Anaerovibrio sp.]|uniref:zinc ribbon domain-containing protein n=1 Tax=Anaerovibrio sp. TaxID=1872532 RepID=UPI0025FE6744|nr:zinc ribbon domain-containing protein [Anaerovibrio sp.]MCR5175580.1 zinc ribbon domain-containing protein [Anaerovibrio sp.]
MGKFCPECGKSIEDNAQFCPFCGSTTVTVDKAAQEPQLTQPQYNPTVQNNQMYQQPPMMDPPARKNMVVAMLLSFLFGPLGMLYTNVKHAAILIVIAIVGGVLTGGLVGLPCWIASMVWTYIDVQKINNGEQL